MPSNQLCCDQMLSDRTTKNRPDGFSLVECLVAVALLGILATLAIPSSSAVQRRLNWTVACAACGWGWIGAGWQRNGIANLVLCNSARPVGNRRWQATWRPVGEV